MKKERLRKLAKYMDKLRVTTSLKFDMGAWFIALRDENLAPARVKKTVQVIKGKPTVVTECPVVKENFCKTSACLLGHAAMMPEFNKLGLKITTPQYYSAPTVVLEDDDEGTIVEAAAGRIFFDLDVIQAKALFFGNWDTPREAAAAVRRLIATGSPVK